MTSIRRTTSPLGVALLLLGAALLGALLLGGGLFGAYLDRQLAQVGGITASVAPNEVNLLAQQLQERQGELDARERALVAQENALAERLRKEVANEYLWVITLLVISILLLLGLVGINFYLDATRAKRRSQEIEGSPGLEVHL